MKKSGLWSIVLSLCILFLFTACGSAKDSSENGGNLMRNEELATDISDSDKAKSDAHTDFEVRKLIKDVYLRIETKEFDKFLSNLEDEINTYNGYVQNSDINGNSYDSRTNRDATIVIRIPAEKLDLFTNQVSSIGNVVNKAEKIRDVTADYIDIESHITALKTEQESLLKLLETATNLTDILSIQDHLTKVRAELETYQTQKNTYDNLITYSTVTIDIDEVERITPTKEKGVWEKISYDFTNNLKNIGKGFKNLFIWVVGNSPYLILITAFVIVITVLIRISEKRRKRKYNSQFTPPGDNTKPKI